MLNIHQEVNVPQLIQECVDVLRFKAEVKGIDLLYQVQNDFPKVLATDGYRMKQILINLMSNAIKYTKKGFVRIDASCDLSKIKVDVVDTGVGIEPSKLSGLFNAFTKITRYREMNQEGVGLGLSISKNLANALDGDISVESLIGVGSKFTLTLPYKLSRRALLNINNNPSPLRNSFAAALESANIENSQIEEQKEESMRDHNFDQMQKSYLRSDAQTQRAYPGLDGTLKGTQPIEEFKDFQEFSEVSRRSSYIPARIYNQDLQPSSAFSLYGGGKTQLNLPRTPRNDLSATDQIVQSQKIKPAIP